MARRESHAVEAWESILKGLDTLETTFRMAAHATDDLDTKIAWHKLRRRMEEIRCELRRLRFEVEDGQKLESEAEHCDECGGLA